MVSAETVGEAIMRWAAGQRHVKALVLIGSRSRAAGDLSAADEHSDWDFHVITSDQERLRTPDWLREAGLPAPEAYVWRMGRLGTAHKINVIVGGQAVDVMALPTYEYRSARWLVRLGLARHVPGVWSRMRALATVVRAGHRVLKGGAKWAAFYDQVVTEVPPLRLDNAAVCTMADIFVCDYVSTRKKVARGELLAAQRWLHVHLLETNYQLLHELRQRRGEPTMPDARRVERLGGPTVVDLVRVQNGTTPEDLAAAITQSAATLRKVVAALTDNRWQWPETIE